MSTSTNIKLATINRTRKPELSRRVNGKWGNFNGKMTVKLHNKFTVLTVSGVLTVALQQGSKIRSRHRYRLLIESRRRFN